jgi:hypothetical protein
VARQERRLASTANATVAAVQTPKLTRTCTGKYTIQASDLAPGNVNKVINAATVDGTGAAGQPMSTKATAAVYQRTGALLPTKTSSQMQRVCMFLRR